MNFAEWEPAYQAILADFGFDRDADRAARDRLATMTSAFPERRLRSLFQEAHVAIAGGGPGVVEAVGGRDDLDVIVAASTAAGALRAANISVDLMVTDLDKTPGVVRALTQDGTPVAVHAHGDNRSLVDQQVPRLAEDAVIPTTQTVPNGHVRNYGGFTDGDRAAFLADHFGADRLVFPGWALDDPSVGPLKARKLDWAGRLLYWLEQRRGEYFPLLDGRREEYELPWL